MGLVLEPNGDFAVLTDILGSEDALGDMDFKVAGDEHGITAFQMDIKVEGITIDIMKAALAQAGAGRRHILEEMRRCSPPPRSALSVHAPRIRSMSIPVEKIGMVIGSGGRTARTIQDATGAELQIEQSGELWLKSHDDASIEKAMEMIEGLVFDPEPGRVYRNARVVSVTTFGAFVEVQPKRDGLLHVSEWDFGHTKSISDVVKEGDLVDVMVLEVVEGSGKIKLSRKAVLELDNGGAIVVDDGGAADAKEGGGGGDGVPQTPKKKNEKRKLKIDVSGG